MNYYRYRRALERCFRIFEELMLVVQKLSFQHEQKEKILRAMISYIRVRVALLSSLAQIKSYFFRLFNTNKCSRYAQNIPHFNLRSIRHAREKRNIIIRGFNVQYSQPE